MAAPKKNQFKGRKVTPQSKGGGTAEHETRLTRAELAEANLATEKLNNRPTSDFSTEELGALMQIAPGAADPHQIRVGKQFKPQD